MKGISLGELIFDKTELIQVDSDARIEEVAKILKEKNILAVPVFDNVKNSYIGIVDVLDMVGYTVWGTAFASKQPDIGFAKFEFSTDTIGEVVANSARAKRLLVYEPTDTLDKLMRDLSYFDHRALVSAKDDRTGKHTYRLISQTDILKYLWKNSKNIEPRVLQAKLQELGLVNPRGSNVYSISSTDKALNGFKQMFAHMVPAVAVVGEGKKIIATLSASDLRGITSEKLENIISPIMDFLNSQNGEKPAVPVTVSSTSTLEEAILKCITAKIHRVWVVNSAQEPIGVVSFSDMIKSILYGDLVHQSH